MMKTEKGIHHLFIDNQTIASTIRIRRTHFQPARYGKVLEPDKPWEGTAVVLFGSVFFVEEMKKYRMWYFVYNTRPGPMRHGCCLAESDDGVHWIKPEVGIFEYEGSKANNIVQDMANTCGPSVIYDRDEPDAARRYKMLTSRPIRGQSRNCDTSYRLAVSYSSDGIHWTPWKLLSANYGDTTTVMLDPHAKKRFVAFTRPPLMLETYRTRMIVRLESEDFEHWENEKVMFIPDLEDPIDMQFYRMTGFPYQSMYLGFLQRLHASEDKLDLELVHSRDNVNWARCSRRSAFWSPGQPGTWESEWVGFPCNPPLLLRPPAARSSCGSRLLFYYEGRNASHGQVPPYPYSAIGLATLEEDRFIAMSAGPVEGELVTVPFVCPGGMLLANMRAARTTGWCDLGYSNYGTDGRCEVLDLSGRPVPGLELSRSNAAKHDHRNGFHFAWGRKRTLDALKRKTIRLRFVMTNMDLFSFWFE